MLYCWPKLPYSILSSTTIPFVFFLSIGWYCGAGVFRLIGFRSLSPTHALPTSFNNNNYNNNNNIILVNIFHRGRYFNDSTVNFCKP